MQTDAGIENTTESSTEPAALFADCMRQHLDDEQLQELLRQLRGDKQRQAVGAAVPMGLLDDAEEQ